MDEHTIANSADGTGGAPSAPPPYVGPPLAPPSGPPLVPSDPFVATSGTPGDYPQGWPPPPQAPRKRKVWPWVLGIGGGLALLVGGGVLALVLVFNNNVADHQNPDYHGDPIAADGAASADGREVVVTGSGSVAFEIDRNWVDMSGEVDAIMPVFPDSDLLALEDTHAWMGTDTPSGESGTMTLVLVFEGELLSLDQLTRYHQGTVDGLKDSSEVAGVDLTVGATEEYTTGQGLDGFVTPVSMVMQGVQVDIDMYSVSRGDRVCSVFVYRFGGTDADTHVVIDTLRIDA